MNDWEESFLVIVTLLIVASGVVLTAGLLVVFYRRIFKVWNKIPFRMIRIVVPRLWKDIKVFSVELYNEETWKVYITLIVAFTFPSSWSSAVFWLFALSAFLIAQYKKKKEWRLKAVLEIKKDILKGTGVLDSLQQLSAHHNDLQLMTRAFGASLHALNTKQKNDITHLEAKVSKLIDSMAELILQTDADRDKISRVHAKVVQQRRDTRGKIQDVLQEFSSMTNDLIRSVREERSHLTTVFIKLNVLSTKDQDREKEIEALRETLKNYVIQNEVQLQHLKESIEQLAAPIRSL